MLLNGNTIDQVTEADLLQLEKDGRVEDLRLEFKQDCYDYEPGNTENKAKKRKEFCKDVAALANAFGGWIICGIVEVNGKASKVLGVEKLDINARKRDFNSWIERDIEPRLYGVTPHAMLLENGRNILIIEVPRSFAGPHALKIKENTNNDDQHIYQFPLRRDGDTTFMTTNDLRRAFVGNASYADQIRDFRRQRVEAISKPNSPDSIIELGKGPLFSVHVLPLSMVEQPNRLSFTSTNVEFAQKALNGHENFSSLIGNRRFNLNGFLLSDTIPTHVQQYFQLYRNGAIEYVKCFPGFDEPRYTIFPMTLIEPYVLSGTAYCVRLLKSLGINEPCYVYLTFARIKRYSWGITGDFGDMGTLETLNKIQHDPLLLPELYVDGWQERIESQMKPLLDIWANTIGLAHSQSYDQSGLFKPKRQSIPIPSTTL